MALPIRMEVVKLEVPAGANIVLGQSHFIKTVEDVYEALVGSVPNIKFGMAFCESSGPCLVRAEGNDEELKKVAVENAMRLSAGHAFVIIMREAWPINVIRAIRDVPEIVTLFCATANPVEIIIAETDMGRAILGVVDGYRSKGVEGPEDVARRRRLLREIGYKLGSP